MNDLYIWLFFFFYVIWSIYHVVSLELKFSEHLLLISVRWGAASTPRIRGCAPWGQAASQGLGQKSSTGAPQLLHAFPGDCKAFCIALPFFLPACEHVQINQWSLKCSFMNIMFHYSFHLFWAEQVNTKKDIFEDDWKHLIYLFISLLSGFQKAVHINWMLSVHGAAVFHI